MWTETKIAETQGKLAAAHGMQVGGAAACPTSSAAVKSNAFRWLTPSCISPLAKAMTYR
jgi:hypothetical protein